MIGFFRKLLGIDPALEIEAADGPTYISPPTRYDGQKFPGGLEDMIDEIRGLDYWALRSRSASTMAAGESTSRASRSTCATLSPAKSTARSSGIGTEMEPMTILTCWSATLLRTTCCDTTV